MTLHRTSHWDNLSGTRSGPSGGLKYGFRHGTGVQEREGRRALSKNVSDGAMLPTGLSYLGSTPQKGLRETLADLRVSIRATWNRVTSGLATIRTRSTVQSLSDCRAGDSTLLNVLHRWFTEEPLVLATELSRALVPNLECGSGGVETLAKHALSRSN